MIKQFVIQTLLSIKSSILNCLFIFVFASQSFSINLPVLWATNISSSIAYVNALLLKFIEITSVNLEYLKSLSSKADTRFCFCS